MAASSSLALKEYLKRYQSGTDGGRVLAVDNDPVWQKPVQLDDLEEEDTFAGDETPHVEEDVDIKRMKRLEAFRSRKPYHSINEDGSGWVSIPKMSGSSIAKGRDIGFDDYENSDLSPARHQSKDMYEKPDDSDKDMSPPRTRPPRSHSLVEGG